MNASDSDSQELIGLLKAWRCDETSVEEAANKLDGVKPDFEGVGTDIPDHDPQIIWKDRMME